MDHDLVHTDFNLLSYAQLLSYHLSHFIQGITMQKIKNKKNKKFTLSLRHGNQGKANNI